MTDATRMQPPAESARWLAEFHDMTTEALRAELVKGLTLTAECLLRLACLVHVLEERGESLDSLKGVGLMHHLRKIACGQLLPEVVVHFIGKPSLISVVSGLPLNDQRRLASGESVAVVIRDGDVRMMNPLSMTPRQVRQTFGRDHIRTQPEQLCLLDDRRERSAKPVPESIGCMKVDRELKCVHVGTRSISLNDLKAAVKALSS